MNTPPPSFLDCLAYYAASLASAWPEKLAITSLVSGLVGLLGGDVVILWALLAMMTADFILGFADAARRHRVRCVAMRRGVLKFVHYALFIGAVGCVNLGLMRAFKVDYLPFLNLFLAYLVATEAISCVAHMQRMGVKVPALLQRIISKSKERIERRIDTELNNDEGEKHGGQKE